MNAAEVASIEVSDKAKRRRFTAEYKRRIVKVADACKTPGSVGELLRREGLYSSHLTTWRAARDRGELAPGSATKKRGPKPSDRFQRELLCDEVAVVEVQVKALCCAHKHAGRQ